MNIPNRRLRLPNRRQSETVSLEFENQKFDIGIGFYPDGTPAEVFARGTKQGSQLDSILDDMATIISVALQYGILPSEISKSLARLGKGGPPSSVVGAIGDALTAYESAGAA